jgi:beta-glucosidase
LKKTNVRFSKGADFDATMHLDEVIARANESDVVILCIGETPYVETSGNIDNLLISNSQIELANKLSQIKVPIVVVYVGGRPRVMTSIAAQASAVLVSFLPGKINKKKRANRKINVINFLIILQKKVIEEERQ